MSDLAVAPRRAQAEEPSWKLVPLGDLCRTTSGGTPSRKRPDYFQGPIPWVKSGELTDGPVSEVEEFITEEALANSSAKVFPAGTLLIALYGATVGKLGVLTRDAATNQAVCAIFPPKELDTRFLFWYLRHRRADLIARAVGGAQPNISQAILRGLDIPVPRIAQQLGIVAEIEKQFSRLDEAVANLKRVKANLKRFRNSTIGTAFDGGLFATDLAFLNGESEARRLPAGWENVNVGRILKVRGGFAFKSTDYKADGVPVIRQTDLIGERVEIAGARRLPGEFLKKYSAFVLRKGDLLIGMSGSLGKISEYVADEPALQNQRTGLLLINQGVSRAFARLVLKYVEPQILASGKGVAVQNVSAAQIEAATFPLPPAEEQARLVAEVDRRLSIVREVDSEVDANLKRAEALRRAVLASAFRLQ